MSLPKGSRDFTVDFYESCEDTRSLSRRRLLKRRSRAAGLPAVVLGQPARSLAAARAPRGGGVRALSVFVRSGHTGCRKVACGAKQGHQPASSLAALPWLLWR